MSNEVWKMKLSKFASYKGRNFACLDLMKDGKPVYRFTFYQSTGRNPKPGISKGDWLITLGIGSDEWINKLTSSSGNPLNDVGHNYSLPQINDCIEVIKKRILTTEVQDLGWDEFSKFVEYVNEFTGIVTNHGDSNVVQKLRMKIHEVRSMWYTGLMMTGKLQEVKRS